MFGAIIRGEARVWRSSRWYWSFRSSSSEAFRRSRSYGLSSVRNGALMVRRFQVMNSPRLFSADAITGSTATATSSTGSKDSDHEKEKSSDKKKGFGIPWGLIFFLGFIGAIVGWFYRGSKNTKRLEALRTKIKDGSALSSEEVEEIREANALHPAHFKALLTRIRDRFPQGHAKPDEFLKYCANELGGEFAIHGFKANHLFERLSLVLEQNAPDESEIDLEVLICAILTILQSDIEERLEILFKYYAHGEPMLSETQVVAIINGLLETNQLPIRVYTREHNEYPFNEYEMASPSYLLARAAQEVKKQRKKHKLLRGNEDQVSENLLSIQSMDQRPPNFTHDADDNKKTAAVSLLPPKPDWKAEKLSRTPIIDLDDFKDLILSRSICAWGECYADKK